MGKKKTSKFPHPQKRKLSTFLLGKKWFVYIDFICVCIYIYTIEFQMSSIAKRCLKKLTLETSEPPADLIET